jgi:hypothetical protein
MRMSGIKETIPPWGLPPFAAYAMPVMYFPPFISYVFE